MLHRRAEQRPHAKPVLKLADGLGSGRLPEALVSRYCGKGTRVGVLDGPPFAKLATQELVGGRQVGDAHVLRVVLDLAARAK